MGKFTAIQTYSRFLSLWNENKINRNSLTFILDTGQLYTHGIFLNSVAYGAEANGAIDITIAGTSKSLSLSSHTHSNYLEKNKNIDIGTYKIVSGDKDLLYYNAGNTYLGNSTSPVYLVGTEGKIVKGSTAYTLLDTDNFSILSQTANGIILSNSALFKYASKTFSIDYIKRYNSTSNFDSLSSVTSAGTTTVNGKKYGFMTFYEEGATSPSWSLIRIDVTDRKLEFRTSSNPTTWVSPAAVSIPTNTATVAGIVSAPGTNSSGKVWKTDANGTPAWRDEVSNTWRNIRINDEETDSLTTGTGTGALYIKLGSGITVAWQGNKIVISNASPNIWKAANANQEGYVPKSIANKILRANADGTLYWGDDANTTYSFSNLLFLLTSGTNLMTYNSQAARTILAGDNITFTHSSNVLTIKATDTWTKFVGATDSSNGTAGYIDAPGKTNKNNFLRGDGTWLSLESNVTSALYVGASNGTSTAAQSTNGNVYLIFKEGSSYSRYKISGSGRASVTSDASGNITINSSGYSNFGAATASAAGSAGLVPAPGANVLGSANYYLRADGTWLKPPNDNTWKAANNSQEGYVPKLSGNGTIATQSTEYVLTFTSGGTGTITPTWKLLPANAFANTWNLGSDLLAGYVPKATKNYFLHCNNSTGVLEWVANPNTNTWRGIYVGGASKVGTGTNTLPINFVAGSNVTITYEAAGTGNGLSGSASYFNIKIASTNTWTAWKGATASANGTAGYMPAPTSAQRGQFLRGDGSWVSLNNYSLPTASNSTLGGVKTGAAITDTTGYTAVAIKNGVIYYKDTNTTYSFYNLLFQNSGGTTVDTYKPTTSPTKTLKAGSNVTISAASNVITIASTNTWNAMTGATSSANGTVGYVNATPPKDGYNTKFLRADGTWSVPAYPTKSSWNYDDVYVKSVSISGNNLRINKNGANTDLTIPYATNADKVDGYHAGVLNGQVSIFVSWPSSTTMISEGFLTSLYGLSGYGHPDNIYLQAICKWAIAHYTNLGDITLIGSIAPNSSGTCIMHLYSSSGRDSSTLLPRYCSATYHTLGGSLYTFGSVDYTWYYRNIDTDTNTWRGILNNLTSDSTTESLSAAQGKALAGRISAIEGDYLTRTTAQTVTGAKTFNNGKWIIAASEANEITTEHFGNGKYYNNANTAVVNGGWSITNALRFRWYSDYWLIGNIRSGSATTAGFGIAFRDNTNVRQIDCFRVDTGGAYIKGYTALHTGNSSVSKSGETLTVNIGGTSYSLTNTNTWRGILNNLTSTSTTDSLSAAQGKALNDKFGSYLPLSGGTLTGNLSFSNSGTGFRGINYGTMGDNDQWRIGGAATGSNAGYMEIATADDGAEPIYVRQYKGVFSTLKRTATLLDGSGNTSFPGTVSASSFSGTIAWSNVSSKPETATRWPKWTEVTDKPSSFAPSAHDHTRILYIDDRDVVETPTDVAGKNGIEIHFKNKSKSSIPSSGTWTAIVMLDGYSDTSGGYPMELGFSMSDVSESRPLYLRSPKSTTEWGGWRTILDSGNSSVSKSGETLTVKINGTSQSLTNSTYTLAGLMGSSAKGSTTQPIYWTGSAFANTSYTLGKSVPSNAVFTDHTYNFGGTTFYSGNSGSAEHNCNNAVKNGHYYYSSNGPATSIGASTSDGALYVQSYSDSWVGQIAQDYRNGRLWVRGKNNGTWLSWVRIANYNEIPSTIAWTNVSSRPTKISLTGSVTGSVSLGAGNLTLSTTTNHSHSWDSVTSKPCTLISYSRNNEAINANSWRTKECSYIEIRGTELSYSNLPMTGYHGFFNFWTPDGIICTQFLVGDSRLYYRFKQSGTASITSSWRQIWTDSYDGSGSGLDADLLDGYHASSFVKNVTGTATSVTSLNVGLTFIYATLTASATLGLSAAMSVGQVLTVLAFNNSSASITLTVPSAWKSLDGYSIIIGALKFGEISILCYASGSYMVSSKIQ